MATYRLPYIQRNVNTEMHQNVSPIGLFQPFYVTICDILFDIFIMASIVPCKELSENLTGVAAALTHNRNLENPIPLISECAVNLLDIPQLIAMDEAEWYQFC